MSTRIDLSRQSENASISRAHGTPIMVGGGVLAHTICGICYEDEAIEHSVRYLILDPHYTGTEDMKNIKKKAVYAWKPVFLEERLILQPVLTSEAKCVLNVSI